jgi:hypothetical protein
MRKKKKFRFVTDLHAKEKESEVRWARFGFKSWRVSLDPELFWTVSPRPACGGEIGREENLLLRPAVESQESGPDKKI